MQTMIDSEFIGYQDLFDIAESYYRFLFTACLLGMYMLGYYGKVFGIYMYNTIIHTHDLT